MITSRRINIGINLFLCVLFGTLTFFATDWWATVMLSWSSGAQFGFACMWFFKPVFDARWQKEMEMEVNLMMTKAFTENMRAVYGITDKPDASPPVAPLH